MPTNRWWCWTSSSPSVPSPFADNSRRRWIYIFFWNNSTLLPLVFTVCKLAIVLQSRSRRTRFNRSQLWAKASAAVRVQGGTRFSRGQQRTEWKENNILPQNKNKPRSKCRSVVSRRHSFRTMKNPRIRRIIRVRSWKSPSGNIAFFCYLRSHYEALTASLSESWLNHEHFRRDFAFYQDEIKRFSSCLVLPLFCFLSKDFSPFFLITRARFYILLVHILIS